MKTNESYYAESLQCRQMEVSFKYIFSLISGSKKDIIGTPVINSFGDHRIAMSFLIASLRSKEGIYVKDCKNIFTSFPDFLGIMKSLGVNINET